MRIELIPPEYKTGMLLSIEHYRGIDNYFFFEVFFFFVFANNVLILSWSISSSLSLFSISLINISKTADLPKPRIDRRTSNKFSTILFSISNEIIILFKWSRKRELNPRPEHYKYPALPLSYCGIEISFLAFCLSRFLYTRV